MFGVMAWDTGTVDLLCNTEGAILKRIGGVWGCSITHYADGHYQSYSTPITISITDGTYQNITGYDGFYTKGITMLGEGVQINKNSTYRLIGTMSFSGGNAGDYEVALFVDGNERHECSFQRTTTSAAIGDAGLTCILPLNASNNLIMKVKDVSPPYQNINIYALNFNIMEIQ